MPTTSAGLLLFRRRPADRVEVFLIHPGGPFWANKDEGAWSIPKGMPNDGEDLLAAAQREFAEETGFRPWDGAGRAGAGFIPLGSITQKAGKVVHAWALEGDADAAAVRSNTFRLQWPPQSGLYIDAPEVDRAEWFDVPTAKRKINPAQAALIDVLLREIGRSGR